MSRALGHIKTAGGTVTFDVDEADIDSAGPERVSRKGDTIVAELDDTLEQALAAAQPAAKAILDKFGALNPETITVEFGLRLDISAGAVIAKAGAEAHFTVTLQWEPAAARTPTSPTEPDSSERIVDE